LNRNAVLDRINPLIDGEVRTIKDTAGTRVTVTPDMVTLRPRKGANLIEVSKEGAQSMVNFVGLPLKVAKEISPNTFGLVLTELLEHTGKYSLILKEDRVTNVIPYGAQTTVRPERLLDIIEKTMKVHDYNRVLTVPDTKAATIEIVGPDTKPVARGDLVRAGVKVVFSPMGTVFPAVQSYALVLNCTNGATTNNVLAEFKHYRGGGGEGDEIWQFFRQSIRKAYGSFSQVVNGFQKLLHERVSDRDRAAMLEALIIRAKINPEVAKAVKAMAIERPPRNAWEMVNLITYASSHLLEAPKQVATAQKVAADFADEAMHAKTCPLCRKTR